MPLVSTMHHEYILKFVAEMVGTAMLVFFGCTGCISAYGEKPSLLDISLNAGFGIMLSITIFGFFSGSFINPAVTVGAMICQILPITVKKISRNNLRARKSFVFPLFLDGNRLHMCWNSRRPFRLWTFINADPTWCTDQ